MWCQQIKRKKVLFQLLVWKAWAHGTMAHCYEPVIKAEHHREWVWQSAVQNKSAYLLVDKRQREQRTSLSWWPPFPSAFISCWPLLDGTACILGRLPLQLFPLCQLSLKRPSQSHTECALLVSPALSTQSRCQSWLTITMANIRAV